MLRVIGLALAMGLAACSIGPNLPKADKEVVEFHAKLNDGKLAEIVAGSGPEIAKDPKFNRFLEVVRTKLGRVVSTKQVGWNENVTTGGHFINLNYQTKFEKGEATENFVFKVDSERLVLVGWHINSDILVLS